MIVGMKKINVLIIIPLLAMLSSCAKYQPKPLDPNVIYDDVYLIMGQSNASGVSPYSFLESSEPEVYQRYSEGNDKVLISYDCDNRIEKNYVPTKFGFGNNETFFGPEIGIAETLSQKEETSYIIKASWSGSCLQKEYIHKNGFKVKYYPRFIKFIKSQLKALEKDGKTPRVRGVFWMQGESDSFLLEDGDYYKVEKYLLDYLRIDLNPWIYDHFNFVDAYIFTRGICWTEPERINTAKQRIADENEHCYCIKTNGEDENAIRLSLKCESDEGDDLAHYDSKSMLLLGKTAGEYLIK